MKVPATALAALVLMAICFPAKAHRSDSGVAASSQKPDILNTPCCLTYTHRRIPRSSIISAYKTISKCGLPAVVLVTKRRRRKICADPKEHWVQKYLKHFQIREH